jgi:hypothetical protein
MIKDYKLLNDTFNEIKSKPIEGCRVFIDDTGIDKGISIEIYESAMSELDKRILYLLAEKYSSLSFKHKY